MNFSAAFGGATSTFPGPRCPTGVGIKVMADPGPLESLRGAYGDEIADIRGRSGGTGTLIFGTRELRLTLAGGGLRGGGRLRPGASRSCRDPLDPWPAEPGSLVLPDSAAARLGAEAGEALLFRDFLELSASRTSSELVLVATYEARSAFGVNSGYADRGTVNEPPGLGPGEFQTPERMAQGRPGHRRHSPGIFADLARTAPVEARRRGLGSHAPDGGEVPGRLGSPERRGRGALGRHPVRPFDPERPHVPVQLHPGRGGLPVLLGLRDPPGHHHGGGPQLLPDGHGGADRRDRDPPGPGTPALGSAGHLPLGGPPGLPVRRPGGTGRGPGGHGPVPDRDHPRRLDALLLPGLRAHRILPESSSRRPGTSSSFARQALRRSGFRPGRRPASAGGRRSGLRIDDSGGCPASASEPETPRGAGRDP
ncbi:MAG: hypothetical protein MZU95_15550 [Desulfomicrobium escambiense]|nr:hypothetical protein [Desulfomicrobium escambiense]